MPFDEVTAKVKNQVSPLASSPASKLNHAPKYKRLSPRLRWQRLRYHWALLFRSHMCIWRSAFDSLRGHIRNQSAKDMLVDFGSATVRDSAGDFHPNTRTHARAEYTKALLAIHPWADIVDQRIFLMGFDAGEQWALHTADKENDKRPDIASWLTCTEQSCGYIPSKIIQPSNAFNSQTSEATPAAIAGVTGNGECYAAEIIGVQIPFVYSSALGSSSDSNHFLRTFRFFARILCPMVDACFLRSSSLSCKAMSIVS